MMPAMERLGLRGPWLEQLLWLFDLCVTPNGLGGFAVRPRAACVDEDVAWESAALHMMAAAWMKASSKK